MQLPKPHGYGAFGSSPGCSSPFFLPHSLPGPSFKAFCWKGVRGVRLDLHAIVKGGVRDSSPHPYPKKDCNDDYPTRARDVLSLCPNPNLKMHYTSLMQAMLQTRSISLVDHRRTTREREGQEKTKIDKKEDRGGWVPFRDLWDHPINTPPQPSHSVNQSSLDGTLRGEVRG